MACPTGECLDPWEDSYIKQLISEKDYKRYEKLKKLAIVDNDPTLVWCIGTDCGKVHKGSDENPHIQCTCGAQMCFKCREKWHPRITCKEVMDSTEE